MAYSRIHAVLYFYYLLLLNITNLLLIMAQALVSLSEGAESRTGSMLKLLTDQNFDNTIVRGLLRCNPNIDIVRATQRYPAKNKCDRSFQFTIKSSQRIKSETDVNPHRYFNFNC
jgi:hypothetical protein